MACGSCRTTTVKKTISKKDVVKKSTVNKSGSLPKKTKKTFIPKSQSNHNINRAVNILQERMKNKAKSKAKKQKQI